MATARTTQRRHGITVRRYCWRVADEVESFLRGFAPDDVRATIAWLLDHGYALSAQHPAKELNTFGSLMVYSGDAEVTVTVDKGQWYMDIARVPGANRHDFGLLLPASRGRPYWECFPSAEAAGDLPLPAQLPPGVSWHDTLPTVLAWLAAKDETEIAAAVALAADQRYAVTWPTSRKARQLRRVWRDRGLPLP